MARYTGPSCRLCRQEGTKLFLKGTRCATEKCAFSRRSYGPGQHGRGRRVKLSNYGVQLREKQKVKRLYGVFERQFRRYFSEASRAKGVTGTTLLQLLERRLDTVILRCGFALSMAQARQMVRYGHVQVNGHKVDVPNYQVKTGDAVKLTAADKFLKIIKENQEITKDRKIPAWLQVNAANLTAEVKAMPARDEVPFPIQEQLIVELFSK
ncbi:MAG: 30S ribosomal protein S4 [Candidatus Omnitrophica bacterium]|nr:30S ribosomal protein S4 [Candidatus Omnitrophota bacterium]